MKKALAGPAKRAAKKKPERWAMIAAARRRAGRWTRGADRRLNALLVAAPRVATWSGSADRRVNRLLVAAWPRLAAAGRRAKAVAAPWARRGGRLLRPLAGRFFRLLARLERLLLRLAVWAGRAATRASALLTPQRGIALAMLGAAACLLASQFVDYRAVEVGQAGYAGLPAAGAPTVGAETAGAAHAYLLVPVALLAAALAVAALLNERRRGLGRIVFALGLVSLAVALTIDLPAGRDAGAEAARFAGAEAVLYDGFYAEVAAAAGLMLGGLLLVAAPRAAARYYARPCRTRTNSFARAASGLRRRRRRRASSRARGARRASPPHSGEASAPASPR
jgi:hypothetical protein